MLTGRYFLAGAGTQDAALSFGGYNSVSTTEEYNQEILTPTLVLSDDIKLAVILNMQLDKSFTDNTGLSDVFSKTMVAIRDFIENIKLLDTINKATSKAFSEATRLTDLFSLTIFRVFTDSLALLDSFSKLKLVSRVFNEGIVLVDTMLRASVIVFSEAISLIEASVITPIKDFVESIRLLDTFQKIFLHIKTFTENLGIRDVLRLISGGISVGRWTKIAKSSTIWRRISKK